MRRVTAAGIHGDAGSGDNGGLGRRGAMPRRVVRAAAAAEVRVSNVEKWGRWAACLVVVGLVLAVFGFGALLPDYSQWRHPVTLLGAIGVPHGQAFSVLGLMLPGLLAAAAALSMLVGVRDRVARVALQLLLLSALAFCAMGLLPLDPTDLDGRASQYHASSWLLWTLGFVPGVAALGLWLRGQAGGARLGVLSLLAALLVGLLSWLPPGHWLPAPLAQRLAFLTWALWWALAGGCWHWPQR